MVQLSTILKTIVISIIIALKIMYTLVTYGALAAVLFTIVMCVASLVTTYYLTHKETSD